MKFPFGASLAYFQGQFVKFQVDVHLQSPSGHYVHIRLFLQQQTCGFLGPGRSAATDLSRNSPGVHRLGTKQFAEF